MQCRPIFSLGCLLLATAMLATPLHAQQSTENMKVHGYVVSALTGEPIPFADVRIDRLGLVAITDDEGYFQLGFVKPGVYRIAAQQLGYVLMEAVLDIDEETSILIELDADPILLDEIAVTFHRLAARRAAAPFSFTTFDHTFLLNSSAFDAEQFVRRYAPLLLNIRRQPVDRPFTDGGPLFMLGGVEDRGRAILSPLSGQGAGPGDTKVFIDGWPRSYELERLQDFSPDDFYVIEIYDQGRIVHAYTSRFIERLANGEARPLFPVYLQARF